MDNIKVFIADEHYLIREGVKGTLAGAEHIQIVGESSDLVHLHNNIDSSNPNVLIFELNLCKEPVRDLIQDLKLKHPRLKFLIISDCDCELPLVMAVRAGVTGFLRKNVLKEELLYAIQQVHNNKEYFVGDITQLLLKGLLNNATSDFSFSDRELEVLRYICKGRSNEQIADILFISEKTIATHRRNIMKKAGVKKSTDLIIWALDNKIVSRS
ncbi:response regulator transcription factor [uncultured Cytophaga sp.]|uniref:LuxR C-terminal-related transcriptional regulator n=1 Tax=uncultured Cytophaga sp. TaxID=160238 RepID=UPI002621F29B|nr:response regulator transcription factor [uncultured Cytophaga sp.]